MLVFTNSKLLLETAASTTVCRWYSVQLRLSEAVWTMTAFRCTFMLRHSAFCYGTATDFCRKMSHSCLKLVMKVSFSPQFYIWDGGLTFCKFYIIQMFINFFYFNANTIKTNYFSSVITIYILCGSTFHKYINKTMLIVMLTLASCYMLTAIFECLLEDTLLHFLMWECVRAFFRTRFLTFLR